jgi:hypothetical protein
MTVETITDRTRLSELRLPWCVDKDTRTEPIFISDERDRVGEALSIRVRDVTDVRVRQALTRQSAVGGSTLQKIDAIVARAQEAEALPEIDDSAAFRVDDELVLMEGCHRTCALYLIDPPVFRLQVLVVDGGWGAYLDRRLAVS